MWTGRPTRFESLPPRQTKTYQTPGVFLFVFHFKLLFLHLCYDRISLWRLHQTTYIDGRRCAFWPHSYLGCLVSLLQRTPPWLLRQTWTRCQARQGSALRKDAFKHTTPVKNIACDLRMNRVSRPPSSLPQTINLPSAIRLNPLRLFCPTPSRSPSSI